MLILRCCTTPLLLFAVGWTVTAQTETVLPLPQGHFRNVDQMLADPAINALPWLIRALLVKDFDRHLSGQQIANRVDVAERRLNDKGKHPPLMHLICGLKDDPSYCQPYYTTGDLIQVIDVPEFKVALSVLPRYSFVEILLGVLNYNSDYFKNYNTASLNILPQNAEFFATYPTITERPCVTETLQEISRVPLLLKPESVFPGDHIGRVLRFATDPDDREGVFRLLLRNRSIEFLVSLKSEDQAQW